MSTSCQPTHSSETTTRKKKSSPGSRNLPSCSAVVPGPNTQTVRACQIDITRLARLNRSMRPLSLSLTLPLFFSLTLFLFPCSHSKPPPPPTFPITDRLAKSLPRAWSDSLDSTHAGRNLCADVIESCQHVKKRE